MFRPNPNKQDALHESKGERQLISVKKKIADPLYLPNGWRKIGDNVLSLIAQYLPADAIRNLELTCRFFHHPMQPILDQRKLEKLAHLVVVEPNEDKVIAMLKVEPTLVNVVIKQVIDSSGRILMNNTIFQLAYGAGDDAMCLAMKPFFIEVYGSFDAGIQEMERQRKEKFAEDKEDDEREDKRAKTHLEALLKPVIEAITSEQFNLGNDADNKLILSAETLAAIETFREEFANSQPKKIEKGTHFRNNTLLETYNAYIQAAEQWTYNYRKCALFEDGVLSCVLLYAPANDAQKFSQGLYYLQDKGETFGRLLTLRVGKNNFYLAVRGRSIDFSLSGSCVDIIWGTPAARRARDASRWDCGSAFYQNLCRTKTTNLQSLCSRANHNRGLGV